MYNKSPKHSVLQENGTTKMNYLLYVFYAIMVLFMILSLVEPIFKTKLNFEKGFLNFLYKIFIFCLLAMIFVSVLEGVFTGDIFFRSGYYRGAPYLE